jgi:hypothetical protein
MKLVPKTVSFQDLLLDPRNPRLATCFQEAQELDIDDPENCQEFLKKQFNDQDRSARDTLDFFSIADLKESMRRIGFVGIQNIIVREHSKSDKYIVLEGNRRVASIKAIIEEHDKAHPGQPGYIEDSIILDSLKMIEVMIFETAGRNEKQIQKDISTMLGLRHYGSQLMWEPLPRAKNIYDEYMKLLKGGTFRRKDELAKAVADTLAIKRAEVVDFLRGYVCYKQLASIFPVKSHHFSLILAGLNNRNLNSEINGQKFFDVDKETFELLGDTPDRFDNVCEFEDRDKPGYQDRKILKDPQAFNKLGLLKRAEIDSEEAISRMAKDLFADVIEHNMTLEDASMELTAFRKRHSWVQALQVLIEKQKSDQALKPDLFLNQGQELLLRDELKKLVKKFLRVMEI